MQRVFVYEAVSYRGDPAESDEMRPQWFKENDLPLKVKPEAFCASDLNFDSRRRAPSVDGYRLL